MITVAYLTNAAPTTGVGHQAAALAKALRARPDVTLVPIHFDGEAGIVTVNQQVRIKVRRWPGILGKKSITWLRLGRAAQRHLDWHQFDLVHATNQTLSFMVTPTLPSLITVHDLIELQEPQQAWAAWFNRYLLREISNATRLVTVSNYTAQQIQNYFAIPHDRITVIPNGVDTSFSQIPHFSQTVAAQSLRQSLQLQPNDRVVLYVGSEHPRKNLSVLIKAFARVQAMIPNLVLIKVGEPGLAQGRAALLRDIEAQNVRSAVRLVGTVSDEVLNDYYNLASVFVYPSRAEGFGLPPLQAMAAGVPVVVSNATSLPEVVGDAGILCDPDDVAGFATAIIRILQESKLEQALRQQGETRAAQFRWESAAEKLVAVYQEVTA